MCNRYRRTLAFIAVISLIWLPLVAAFSSTSWAVPARGAHRKAGNCRRRTHLFEKKPLPHTEGSSCTSSRRGFITHVAAAAACGAIAVSPANSIPLLSDDANTNTPSINKISISSKDKNPSSPTLAANASSSQTVATNNEYTLTALQESISGFVSGSAVSTVKTLIKYPLDTATVRLQMPGTEFTIQNLPALFSGSFDGITAPLVSNIPAGAIFFAVKDAVKSSLKGSDLGLPKWALTSLAVGVALPPYWLIRNPSEVVKTRLQVGAEGYYEGMSTVDAFRLALSNGNSTSDGVSDLYQGYSENVLYGFPADIIKFVAYDTLTGGKGKKGVSPVDGAVFGAMSTAFAQVLTTPLDVLRNRIMADPKNVAGADEAAGLSYVDRLVKIAEEEGMSGLFAGTSPRIAKAVLSGAIQFATYEETKQKMSQFFMRRQ